MAQHEIPATGEQITFTVKIRQEKFPQFNVTVKQFQLSLEQRIVRITLTDEEWSQVFSLVMSRSYRQCPLLEFLRNGSNQQRTQRSVYARYMSGEPKGGGFFRENTSQVNKTLKNAGLPFRIRHLPGQEGKVVGDRLIALVVIQNSVES